MPHLWRYEGNGCHDVIGLTPYPKLCHPVGVKKFSPDDRGRACFFVNNLKKIVMDAGYFREVVV